MKENLELRMYYLTMYNLSQIQIGIQAGHAKDEYSLKFGKSFDYIEWINNHKTYIILNGGTSNDGNRSFYKMPKQLGTMEQHLIALKKNKIKCTPFYEPDLNYSLSAIAFIVDERVFNKAEYPNFVDYILDVKMYPEAREAAPAQNIVMLKMQSEEKLQEMFPEYYKEWVRFIGGVKNVFLRELLKDKKKA